MKYRPGMISFIVDKATGCWLWQRSKMPNGYGHLTVNNRQICAHRFVYEKLKGSIPEGFTLDHLCRQPACVNPKHLEPVLYAENCRRGKRAKLNHEKVKELKYMADNGETIMGIAQRNALDRHTVRNAIRGVSWK